MVPLLDCSLKVPLRFEEVTPFKISYTIPERSIDDSIQRGRLGFALIEISNSNVVHFLPLKAAQLGFSLQGNSEIKF